MSQRQVLEQLFPELAIETALFLLRLGGRWHEVLYGLRMQRPALVESGLAGARSRLPPALP